VEFLHNSCALLTGFQKRPFQLPFFNHASLIPPYRYQQRKKEGEEEEERDITSR
jgi:hypothetical protein